MHGDSYFGVGPTWLGLSSLLVPQCHCELCLCSKAKVVVSNCQLFEEPKPGCHTQMPV